MERRKNQRKPSKHYLNDSKNRFSASRSGSLRDSIERGRSTDRAYSTGDNPTLETFDNYAAFNTRKSSNQSNDKLVSRHGSSRDDAERGRDA
jgi:hypothetical protein